MTKTLLQLFKNLYRDFRSFELSPMIFFILLLSTDLAYLVAHFVEYADFEAETGYLLLTSDQSYSEIFQYTKFAWITLILAILSFRVRNSLYLIFSILFFFLMLDDMFSFHEALGDIYKGKSDSMKLTYAFVQVAYGFFILFLFLLVFYIARKFSRPTEDKQFSGKLIILILLLGAFGVGVDFFHSVYNNLSWSSQIVGKLIAVVEDFGEMIICSMITAWVFSKYLVSQKVS